MESHFYANIASAPFMKRYSTFKEQEAAEKGKIVSTLKLPFYKN